MKKVLLSLLLVSAPGMASALELMVKGEDGVTMNVYGEMLEASDETSPVKAAGLLVTKCAELAQTSGMGRINSVDVMSSVQDKNGFVVTGLCKVSSYR